MAAPSGYVNPLQDAQVRPERIDMGVDYAGAGTLLAIARGIVTQVNPGGWGKYGNYIAYKITQPGPLFGRDIYYAEGVTPTVRVGQQVNAGDTIGRLISGWPFGIEIGYGSDKPNTSYAQAYGGGYTENELTASGLAFSNLIKQLGGPPGLTEGRTPHGTSPGGAGDVQGQAQLSQQSPGLLGQLGQGFALLGDIAGFVTNPVPAVLTIALVAVGAVLIYEGFGRMLGAGSPIKSTMTGGARAAAMA